MWVQSLPDIPGQGDFRQLAVCVTPFSAMQAAPPFAAGRVTTNCLDRVPEPHVALHELHAVQLPTQSTVGLWFDEKMSYSACHTEQSMVSDLWHKGVFVENGGAVHVIRSGQ
jgi:hypothetical protein